MGKGPEADIYFSDKMDGGLWPHIFLLPLRRVQKPRKEGPRILTAMREGRGNPWPQHR